MLDGYICKIATVEDMERMFMKFQQMTMVEYLILE